jgi:hypothetical protein
MGTLGAVFVGQIDDLIELDALYDSNQFRSKGFELGLETVHLLKLPQYMRQLISQLLHVNVAVL